MTRRSPREIDRRLDELEDADTSDEWSVEITRHTLETFDADRDEYDLETVSESDWLTIREAIVDE